MYFSIPVHEGAGGLVIELRHDAAVKVHSEGKREQNGGSEGCRVRRRHAWGVDHGHGGLTTGGGDSAHLIRRQHAAVCEILSAGRTVPPPNVLGVGRAPQL